MRRDCDISYLLRTDRSQGSSWGFSVPGGRHLHHKGTRSECTEKDLLGLKGTSQSQRFRHTAIIDCRESSRLLKLFTGVETSTLPVSKSGNEGNKTERRSRRTKAPPNTATFRRSTAMMRFNTNWTVES